MCFKAATNKQKTKCNKKNKQTRKREKVYNINIADHNDMCFLKKEGFLWSSQFNPSNPSQCVTDRK